MKKLESILIQKIWFILNKTKIFSRKRILNLKIKKITKKNTFFFKKLKLKNSFLIFFKCFILSLIFKNTILLNKTLIKLFEKLNVNQHYFFLFFVQKIINLKIVNRLFKKHNILGLLIKIKGKINTGGDSRTRKYFIKKKKHSSNTIKYKLNKSYNQVNTLSGVLGLKTIIIYK